MSYLRVPSALLSHTCSYAPADSVIPQTALLSQQTAEGGLWKRRALE